MATLPASGCGPPSPLAVAVIDNESTYRRGIAALLREERAAVVTESEHDDAGAVVAQRVDVRLAVVCLRLAEHSDTVVELRRQHQALPLLAIVFDSAPATYRHALLSGATGVLPSDAGTTALLLGVEAVLRGYAVLPTTIAGSLIAGGGHETAFSTAEIAWLRQLADGATIASLARRAGIAERSFYRLLEDLYQRLGVVNRSQALHQAAIRGLLAEPESTTSPQDHRRAE